MNRPDFRLASLVLAWLCTPLALAGPQQTSPPAPSAPGENAASGPETSPPLIAASELELTYFVARAAEVDDLLRAINGLATRKFYVRNADGTVTGPVPNVREFTGDTLVIYDRPDRVEQIKKFLTDLEQAAARAQAADEQESGAAQPLQIAEYSPRNVPLDGLLAALRPLIRMVEVPDSDDVQNVTAVAVPARLVLRDTPDNVRQMLDLLERIDVPAPQLMLHCWLLHGVDRDARSELPPDLVDNLRRLVPFAGFERESMAILRTSIVSGQQLELRGQFQVGDSDERFDLKLEPAGYDARAQLLTLGRCAFESTTGQQFTTAAVVKVGEYVVLGAAGSDPLFVVLRVTPVMD